MMKPAKPLSAGHALASLIGKGWEICRPPVETARFWLVQAGILSIALVDEVLLDGLHIRLPFGVPSSATTGLLFVPVIYAALNFGRRGAIATAIWATIVVVPHWSLLHHLSAGHFWIEVLYLIILNAVAIVVGQRVESEQRARRRAEDALAAARSAEARYRGLFEEQPAPVIISNSAGLVTEVNTAATRLLGRPAAGLSLSELLNADVGTLLAEDPPCLRLAGPDGEDQIFVPTAHELTSADGSGMVQIVLTDVTEQHRRRQEQEAFAGRLLAVQEELRRQVAHELHDDPLQNLIFLTRELDDVGEDPELAAGLACKVRRGSRIASEVVTALRKVISGLRPPILDDLGVLYALRQLAEESRVRSGLSIDLRVRGEAIRLSPELELTVYRVIQESLSNVIRHASASHVTIRVRFGERIVLTISDDGCGIPPAARRIGGPDGGFGLLGMRERVNLAGGALDVRPRRPHGTTIRVTLPFPRPQETAVPMSPVGISA